MAVLFMPPVLARFMQRNPWRGDAEGKSMGMGGVNQQYKRQLQKKAAEGQGKCQPTEEIVPLQSREQKGHSVGF